MERCPFCQTTLLNAFALTCKQCGRRVQPELSIDTQQVTLATEPPVLSCPACGEVIPSGARFCGKCGQVVKHQKNGEVALAVSIALVSLLLLGIPNIVLLVGIITLVISLVSLFIARWSIRSWLPGGDQWRLSRRRGQTLGLPIQKLFGWNDIYYLSYLFLYGFYIYEKIIQDILNK